MDPPKAPSKASTTANGAAAEQPPADYISDRRLEKLPSDSPERAILTFWQAVQYKNLLVAYDGLAKDFQTEFAGTLPRFSKYISADFQHWLTQPRFISTKTTGSTALVVISYRPPGGVEDRSTVTLVRESGKWRIAYNFYLANRLRGQ